MLAFAYTEELLRFYRDSKEPDETLDKIFKDKN
jgi:hypothetical protein